ncbi:IS481 family transposase [Ectothiorhodospira lacustris]|uniref:IS481 family transposase n=1 Tax=Ectothiorhodospira lacustris TaxID=2899127 RepID=UPI001EE92F17|nr:IS481 family transposase [Ectothiorhodospira lacustris]MCG5500483.1 IS481 family transposase [Ectothiorhodospira lacustris]
MPDPSHDLRHEIALFRFGLIADLVRRPPGAPGLYTQLHAIAARTHQIPGSHRTHVAAETLRDWMKKYRQGGFDALLPRSRQDRGQPRRLPAAVTEALIALKEAHPCWSVRQVIQHLRDSGGVDADLPLPPSTIHRLFTRHGLMQRQTEAVHDQDRRRFAFAQAGQLWSSDVMHGPSITVEGRVRRKTYLIAFMDDATRVVPQAAFALAENTRAFLPVLRQALSRRGVPERLYVDNGANYRSHHLALVCAKLGIALIHARPYRPQGKGKIERFFRTVRAQLLNTLTPEDTASLEALNRRLWAWVEGEYHHNPHRGLDGMTPLERWAQDGDQVRYLDPSLDLEDLCLFEAARKVHKDRTVSLDGVIYEVDAALIGERVTLRYDPGTTRRTVQIVHQGRYVETARPVDLYANCFVKRNTPSGEARSEDQAPQPSPSGMQWRDFDIESAED